MLNKNKMRNNKNNRHHHNNSNGNKKNHNHHMTYSKLWQKSFKILINVLKMRYMKLI